MSATTLDAPRLPLTGVDPPGKKVIFCSPCLVKPHPAYLKAMAASVPLVTAAGWDEGSIYQIGCPYISAARSIMLRKALDAKADVIVFLDYDLSWAPGDLLRLIETPGEVVAGTYRYKREPEEYMGMVLPGIDGRPIVRKDGCVRAYCVPAGFLKVTRTAVNKFMADYPELCYGEKCAPHVDLFNHGARDGVWYGEDYAFCRRWTEKEGQIWVIPDLAISHHAGDKEYPGNYHQWLLRQPGGSESANPVPPERIAA